MTKEEAIETIKDICLTTEQLTRIEKALECLLSQPSLPSDLDEAAEKYSENILANNEDLQDAIEDAFKAGAEWMAGQGYTKEETVYFERLCDENRIMVDLGWGEPERGGFNPGDKVIVQIRKKQ